MATFIDDSVQDQQEDISQVEQTHEEPTQDIPQEEQVPDR